MSSSDLLLIPNIDLARNIISRAQQRQDHFRSQPQYTDYNLSELPTPETLLEVINVAFWASLTREEGQELRFSLALVSDDNGVPYYPLQPPVPFTREAIRKIANAYDRSVAHLRVDRASNGMLCIWGGLMGSSDGVIIIDAIEPGLLAVLRISREHERLER